MNGKTLPHNEDAEKALLGAVLLNANALQTAMEYVAADDFYHSGHKALFEALVLYQEEKQLRTLDFVSIVDFLKSKAKLAECGGIAYISSLTENVTNVSMVPVHGKIIHSLALRRRLILLANDFISDAYDESQEVAELIDRSEVSLGKLADGSGEANKDHSVQPFLTQALANIKERMMGKKSGNLLTGFAKLDSMTDGGFHPSDFIIIAARPSIGKTAFASSIIQHMITSGDGDGSGGYSVAFYSLEMSGMQVSQRMISSISKVPLKTIRNATFSDTRDRAFNNVMNAASKLFDSKLYIFDTPNMRLADIRTSARRLQREQGIQAIFIDYIGLIDSGLDATVPRFEQVAMVSRSLKALARELNIPVVVLCQVSRDAEGDKNEPQLNNLRDSGAIEQDADMVMFLHRSRKVDNENLEKDSDGNASLQKTKVIVAKQRNGETGEFNVGFKPSTASFENLAFEH